MYLFVSFSLVGVMALWLLVREVAKRKLRDLQASLPATYHSAIVAPTLDTGAPQLILLAIDLMRKKHCRVGFEELTENEKQVALFAYAIDALPAWAVNIGKNNLAPSERTVVQQLQFIKTSRPEKKPVHFGAIERAQQLRSATEG